MKYRDFINVVCPVSPGGEREDIVKALGELEITLDGKPIKDVNLMHYCNVPFPQSHLILKITSGDKE